MSNQPITEAAVREAISSFKDPESGRSVVQLGQIHQLELQGEELSVTLGLTTWSALLAEDTRLELIALLNKQFPALKATVKLAVHERKPEAIGEIGLKAKSVIAVAAGKGGVGKSSVAGLFGLRSCPSRQPGGFDGCRRLWPQYSAFIGFARPPIHERQPYRTGRN